MSNSGTTFLSWLEEIGSERVERDYEARYWDSTKETLVGLYSDRENGEPIETVSQIVSRVADSMAIGELPYILTPGEIVKLKLGDALDFQVVKYWADVFSEMIGRQYFWMNTPANINANPSVALSVIQYEAYGKLSGMNLDDTWLKSEEYRQFYLDNPSMNQVDDCSVQVLYKWEMGRLADSLQGKGCLAACGVNYVHDTLQDIQGAAFRSVVAAKNAMGFGINTSNMRPWSSLVSNGAAASGPDRFYQKTIASAVEAVAQGGRRGGALIEWRNSDHPDILFFIDKKRIPVVTSVGDLLINNLKTERDTQKALAEAIKEHATQYHRYMQQQDYLKNTNISVLAMPGFMDAVLSRSFYPATYQGEKWGRKLYDPRKPRLNQYGFQEVSKLTKEPIYEEYSVDLTRYPEAQDAALAAARIHSVSHRLTGNSVTVQGFFYAPEVFDRIVENMRDSGEPGIGFYDRINEHNANSHHYDLVTTNPCGEQALPAGKSKDGTRNFLGICNLSSLNAAHADFWNPDNSYRYEDMRKVAEIQQRAMDNVTTVSWFPLPEQNLTSRLERRNGAGFAGVAEYLCRLELRFGTQESHAAVEKLFKYLAEGAYQMSHNMAKERGVYPLWYGSGYELNAVEVRNTCMLNNAPTGTLAQAMQTTWGVEPLDGIVFSRKVRSRKVDFVAPGFREAMARCYHWPESELEQSELMTSIRENKNGKKSVKGLSSIPKHIQHAFPIRVEIDPNDYIDHLAACYRGACDTPAGGLAMNSISNTCLLPRDPDAALVRQSILRAHEHKVKAITLYPDGCRLSQPIDQVDPTSEDNGGLFELLGVHKVNRVNTDVTEGATVKMTIADGNGGQKMHVTLNHEDGKPGRLLEVFAKVGKAGCIENGLFEALGRLSSAFLQYAAQFGEVERQKAQAEIVKQLSGIESGYVSWHKWTDKEKPSVIKSACDALAGAIRFYDRKFSEQREVKENVLGIPEKFVPAPVDKLPVKKVETRSTPPCPKCGEDTVLADGCPACPGCGYSKCG